MRSSTILPAFAATALFAAASIAAASKPGKPMTDTAAYLASPQARADLGRINDQFIDNFVRNDVAAHSRLIHPAFIHIGSDGSRTGREQYLKEWATGFDPDVIVYWDVRDELITLVGDVALVRSTNKQVVRREGVETSAMTTYTDTYVYQQGRWQCIQAQITRVAPDKQPPDSTIKTVYIRGVRQQ